MIYIGNNQITQIYFGSTDLEAAYLAETKVYPEGHDQSTQYFTTVALGSGDISLSGSSDTNTFSYSTDEGETWSTLARVSTVTVSNGDKVMWKGTPTPISNYGIGKLSSTANFNVEGNAMSLLFGGNFQGQTDLTGKDLAFESLFENCSSLISAENLVLPATTLASNCYNQMFYGCTSLTTAPELSAMTLALNCYNLMFYNCTSLTAAPELPATTLAEGCYSHMFYDCTSLTEAPQLPATTLVKECYRSMFHSCSTLNSITCLATDISANFCTYDWVDGVAASGTFTKAAEMEDWVVDSIKGIPQGWTVKNYGEKDYSEQYFTTEALGSGNISLSGSNTANTFSYSTDEGSTWSTPAQVSTVSVSNGDKVLWKGEPTTTTTEGIGKVTSTTNFNVEGNIMSLGYGDNFRSTSTIDKENMFRSLFYGDTTLQSAENLVLAATTLNANTYYTCFRGCSNMTKAPIISATTLAGYCFYDAFRGCSSLTEAPVLPAITMAPYAYCNMFYECTSLTEGPELPATTLANNCYQFMHYNCTAMTKAATVLPATTLANACYSSMYRECTSLTTPPKDLPATVLPNGSYFQMFYGCTSLTEIPSLNLSNVHQNACKEMFAGCTSLESITLPSVYSFYSTSVTNTGACQNMFSGCSSLRYVNADENYDANIVVTASQDGCREMFRGSGLRSLHVVARSQAPRGLQGMFNECHALTNVYVDVTLDNNANQGAIWMFTDSSMQTLSGKITMSSVFSGATYMMQRCTSLTDASNFEIDIQGRVKMQNCDSMFDHCSSLRNLPHFSTATTEIGDYSCQYMFANCTSLTSAKDFYVPSGYLGTGACQYMFKNCTSLTESPVLSAATVGNSSYYQMFYNCSNLSEITCLATNISAAHSTETWTTNVAHRGTFYKASEMENWQIDSVNGIPVGWTVKNYGEKDYSQEYFTTVALSNGTIRFKGSNSSNKLSYSTDEGSTWTEMTSQTVSVPVNEGDSVMWKGETTPIANGGIGTFTSAATANFNVEGNAMSLLYGDNFLSQTDLSGNGYSLERLFSGNTHLASAENLVLPATTLSSGCYKEMFSGCTSLTTAPQLPAMTLTEVCYSNMFDSCTSLTIAPELPATTLGRNCYEGMFQGCTNLTTAPTVLPATTLTIGCYNSMFNGCTSLTTAPSVLPAATLTNYCYSRMFSRCTNLATAPALPATTLADYCYEGMFMSCGSLTTAPALHATTLANYSYNNMFYRCSNISSIECLATDISATDCTKDWVDGVASTGTFTKAASMTSWTTGTSGIPSGWTVADA